MKKISFIFAVLLTLTAAGCKNTKTQLSDYSISEEVITETQDEINPTVDTDIEKSDLPPEDTDCLAVANDITIAFQSLYRNYLQVEGEDLLFKIDKDYSSAVYFDDQPGYGYLPLINDEIRCCEDLKEILMEYCTDEFATVLLEAVHYRDFERRLYKPAEDGRVDIGRAQFGCYINECTLDGDKMTVGFIKIGAENDNFDIDLERYCRMSTQDQTFEMTLVWKNGKWFISGLSSSDPSIKGRPCPLCWADSIAFSYREDITKAQHGEISPTIDSQTDNTEFPPRDTDCLAVANEITIAFQTLYRNYLQVEESELSFKIDRNSMDVYFDDRPGLGYIPVIDDEIRCCDDLKRILIEYCTDEFAVELLKEANYRDFEGRLYRPREDGRVDIGKAQFGCYIDESTRNHKEMTVSFISIGAKNENFDIDLERYSRMTTYDQPFEMTLVWKNGKWLISGLSSLGWADTIAFSYREDITKSMHETN